MPEYLAPGVFVEEVSYRAKSIEGVSTTTTGFIGPTRYGPIDIEPEIITSLVEFERIYGARQSSRLRARRRPTDNYMWHAVRAFFEQGGKRLYVARVFHGRRTRTTSFGLRDRRHRSARPAVPAGQAGIRGPRALSRARPATRRVRITLAAGPEPARGRRGRRASVQGLHGPRSGLGHAARRPPAAAGLRSAQRLGASMRVRSRPTPAGGSTLCRRRSQAATIRPRSRTVTVTVPSSRPSEICRRSCGRAARSIRAPARRSAGFAVRQFSPRIRQTAARRGHIPLVIDDPRATTGIDVFAATSTQLHDDAGSPPRSDARGAASDADSTGASRPLVRLAPDRRQTTARGQRATAYEGAEIDTPDDRQDGPQGRSRTSRTSRSSPRRARRFG